MGYPNTPIPAPVSPVVTSGGMERAWFETGDFQQVNDVDLVDIREIKDSEMDSLHDLAHEVVA